MTNTHLDKTRHIGSKGIRVKSDTSGGVVLESLLNNSNINSISGVSRVFTREHVEGDSEPNINYTVSKSFSDVRFNCNEISTDVIHECLAYLLTFNTPNDSLVNNNSFEPSKDAVKPLSGKFGDRNRRNFHTKSVYNNSLNNLSNNIKLRFVIEDDDGLEKHLSLRQIQSIFKLFDRKGKH